MDYGNFLDTIGDDNTFPTSPPPAFTATFKRTMDLSHPNFKPSSAVFTPDGKRIIACGTDSAIVLFWDSATGGVINGPVTFATDGVNNNTGHGTTDGSTPTTAHGSTPTNPYASTPTTAYGSTPTNPYASTPTTAYGSTPTTAYGSTPTTAYGSTPTTAYGSTPANPYASTLTTAYGSTPTTAYGSTPTTPYGSTPTTPYGSTPTTAYGSTPSTAYGSTPTAAYGSTPTAAYGSTPTTAYGSTPTTAYGRSPQPAYGSTAYGGSPQPAYGSNAYGGSPQPAYTRPPKPAWPPQRQFVMLSRDGTRLFAGSGSFCAETADSWDIETRQSTSVTLGEHIGSALSYDGKKLFTYAYFPKSNPTRVWDLVAGTCITGGPTKPSSASAAEFSPDGKMILTVDGQDGRLHFWDANTANITSGPHEHGSFGAVRSLAFSPNGKSVALGLSTGKIVLMDSESGDIIPSPGQFNGHTDWASSLAFSPNGEWIVSASWDQTVRVWDATTGHAVSSPLKGHQDKVQTVIFSPDGKKVISTGDDGHILVWTLQ